MGACSFCNKPLVRGIKYCSNACQADKQYEDYIHLWLSGKKDGGRGKTVRTLSRHVRRYMLESAGYACSQCGWSKTNPRGNFSPLEIDHKDGDSENNHRDNLRVLCPNCHSLTENYRNLNVGFGREWRRSKYIKNDKPA